MKKKSLIVIMFCAVIVAYFLTRYEIFGEKENTSSAITENVSSPTSEKLEQVSDASTVKPLSQKVRQPDASVSDYSPSLTLAQRVEIMQVNRPGRALTESEIQKALSESNAWEASSSINADLKLSNEEIDDGRVFVDLKPFKIESLMEGDSVTFPIPFEDEDISFVVDQVTIQGGSVRWHSGGMESDTSFSASSWEKNSMAGIVASKNSHYTFYIEDGRGWIKKTGALMKIDPNVSAASADAVMPTVNDDSGTPAGQIMPVIDSKVSAVSVDANMP